MHLCKVHNVYIINSQLISYFTVGGGDTAGWSQSSSSPADQGKYSLFKAIYINMHSPQHCSPSS